VQLDPQQGWPGPPHVPQEPFPHVAAVPPALQALPLPTQRFPSQQPPAEHPPLAQHGWPSPPQAWQVIPTLAYQQTFDASLQVLPSQHGWSLPPHIWQTPPLQAWPEGHTPPGQHGSFAVPHAVQVPAEQVWPELQTPPRQHCWPGPPQSAHLPDWHANPDEQRVFAQHGSPLPPHATHEFAPLQTSLSPHRSPTMRQTFADATVVSQHPVLHWSPEQHGCPLPPHPAHLLLEDRQRSPL
jgi:hypothetical protein